VAFGVSAPPADLRGAKPKVKAKAARPVAPFIPSVGAAVRVREQRGFFGHVTAVSLPKRRACVCLIQDNECFSKSFDFDQLAAATQPVPPCKCRDECDDL
jgi:hypothetical protein